MQEVFTLKEIDWDDELPEELLERWRVLASELHLLEALKIQRHVPTHKNSELHIFCDASKHGIGSCLYVANKVGEKLEMNLLLSQVNVVPPNSGATIPRNELNALVLGAFCIKSFS